VNNSLNLASKPFNNRIVPWALTALILFVSLIGLVVVVRLTTNARREAGVTEAKINELKQRELVHTRPAAGTARCSRTDRSQRLLMVEIARRSRVVFAG
jgi:hypothetical protein